MATAATPDGNDVTLLPIPSPEVPSPEVTIPEGSMDLGKGTTNVLRSAQEQALAAETHRKRAHTPHPGKSERTMSRERLAWRKLAAQGFSTLPDFFRQKAEKEQREARLAAMVAAHSAQRSVQPKRYILEEEEETESDSGPDTGSSSCTPASGVHIPSDSETCRKASPIYLEESEESEDSSSSCETSSASDDDESDHNSECPPSKRMRHDLDNTQGAITRRLEELRHGNNHSIDPKLVLDNTLEFLQDRARLEAVQEQLVVMAGDKKLGPTLCSRVQAMAGILNLFLDRDLGYTWRQASLVVARSQAQRTRTRGNDVTRARSIHHWVLHFIQTQELPHHKYSRTHSIILEDEDVS
ncbi:hypothetical protein EDB85DRAFT_2151322 [Lactarius pseudohatsudake]|nr:hypothetical protein EDB85DRAFT_2151322 [Lactarius pseudohatsudake]